MSTFLPFSSRHRLSGAPLLGLATALFALSACSDKTTEPASTVSSITVTPRVTDLRIGATQQLAASAFDVAGGAVSGKNFVWSSAEPTIATVSAAGLVTVIKAGSTSIFARVDNVSGFAAIVGSSPISTVSIVPLSGVLPPGQSVQLVYSTTDATGGSILGRPLTFTSSAPTVVTVSSTGLLTGVAAGTATVSLTAEGKTGTVNVTVAPLAPVATIALTPIASTAATGTTVQLTTTMTAADGTLITGRATTFTSSAPTVASVNASGLVTVLTSGTVTITATSEGKSATATINQLVSGTGLVIAGPLNSTYNFFILVPANARVLNVILRGAAGQDPDLDVFAPGAATAICSSGVDGPNENCNITTNVVPGLWRVLVTGYTAYANITLTATVTAP